MIQTTLPTIGPVAVVPPPSLSDPIVRARQWELVECVGQGSLACVYRARPSSGPSDRPAAYAVKMLRREWQNDREAIRLLQHEALAGSTVSHPHVIPILAAHVVDTPRMLVMPWLDGGTLLMRLQNRRRFDLPTTLWIVRQVAEALDAFHAVGWMHGDVTPGNIHLSTTGHVTLLDLTFARSCQETGSAADRMILGTCNYIAPEQITSALRADIRSDLFSLGAVLFEMLTGRPPFLAKDMADLATQHRQSSPPDLFHLAPHLPRQVFSLVRQLLANDPLRRPQTPRELVDRLVGLEIATFADRS